MIVKHAPDELAIAGGSPAFPEPLHVGRPNLPDRRWLHEALDRILDERWLTNRGPFVQQFEAALSAHLGVDHCVAVCNATIGLELALHAVGARGEVVVPGFTFVATAHAASWLGLTPVFCDVDARTHTIDVERIEALITPRTSAIVATHLWGRPCDVRGLEAIARRHGLALVFDAAHAFSCAGDEGMVGRFGDLEVFSFHATKFLNSFEGGAVTTNSAALAERVRLMSNFGFAGYDSVVERGTNGKMHEMSAAMGLASLGQLESLMTLNRRHHEAYRRELAALPGLTLLTFDDLPRHNHQYVVVYVDETQGGVSRDDLVRMLWAEGVRARRYFAPGCHRVEPYTSSGTALPVTEVLAERLLTLPTGTGVTSEHIVAIAALLRLAVAHPAIVRGTVSVAGASRQ